MNKYLKHFPFDWNMSSINMNVQRLSRYNTSHTTANTKIYNVLYRIIVLGHLNLIKKLYFNTNPNVILIHV